MEDEDTALESINFVQVFVLTAQGQTWAIQNDILRFDAFHHRTYLSYLTLTNKSIQI